MAKEAWDEASLRVAEGIDLDEKEGARNKAQRLFRMEAIHTPVLRFLAFGMGALLLFLHNRVIFGQPGWAEFRVYGTTLLVYGFSSWALLYCLYGRTGWLDLSLVFIVLDVFLLLLGLHLSGLERSWLFPLLLIRVGDQSHTTFRRAMGFAHFVPVAYLAWLFAQPRAIPWPQEIVKAVALYMGGVYLASTTVVVEGLRKRTQRAVHVSRDLIVKLKVERQKALDASQAKSDFLSAVSHDLRTPLNAILLYSQLVEGDAQASGQEDLAVDMQKIQGAGTHLLQLLNNLLDLAKIEAGMLTLYLEDISVPVLVEEIRVMAEPLVRKNQNRLVLEVDPALKAVSGDLTRLKQVLLNLLGNASKFTDDGVITLRLGLEERKGQPWLFLEVEDTGIGMTPDQCQKVFSEYVQAEEGTTRRHGGTGLGLALCRQLAHLMEGEIRVESEPGRGSTFTVEIPYQPPSEVPLGPMDPGLYHQPGTILLIEDDADFREGLVRFLKQEGFEAIEAATGEEGLEMAARERPDLITLDVALPGLSGWEVLGALKADEALASIPVILLTLSEDRSQGFALGASDFLPKPIDPRKCVNLLRRHLGRNTAGSVLLVEDDLRLREALGRTLEGEGWTARSAGDGQEALTLLQGGWTPDLVLLDLQLPGMDGFQFLEALRENPTWKQLPVIVATGLELRADQRQRLASQGVQDLVSKGALPREELLRQVGHLARGRMGR